MFWEEYKDEDDAALENHNNSAHFKQFFAAAAPLLCCEPISTIKLNKMKKTILAMVAFSLAIVGFAQSKFEVKDLGKFKLHSYITADPLGDINYLIETPKGIVVVEPAAFYDNIKEMNAYIKKLGKPVVKVISDYHIAGYTGFDKSKYVMVQGMPEFSESQVYAGMMSHFANVFKDKMDVT